VLVEEVVVVEVEGKVESRPVGSGKIAVWPKRENGIVASRTISRIAWRLPFEIIERKRGYFSIGESSSVANSYVSSES